MYTILLIVEGVIVIETIFTVTVVDKYWTKKSLRADKYVKV